MPSITLGDIEIDFPYTPYECQKNYMQAVIDALNEKKHAILESPTGTGKTLCLLCASLGWLEYFLAQQQLRRIDQSWEASKQVDQVLSVGKFDAPLIIFSSRTHAQLNQAVQAFKDTVYSSHKIGVLGSRDQLCLLPEVASLESNPAKVYQCRLRVSTPGRDKLLASMRTSKISDIEDLCKFGRDNRACAYYLSREVKADAEILFMPYNYLLDVKIRSLYGIELTNAIVIFDEAHNIEQVCEDAASATLTSTFLASAIEELRVMGEYIFNLTSVNEGGLDELEGVEGFPGQNFAGGIKNQFDLTEPSNNAAQSIGLSSLLTLKGQLLELERILDGLGETASDAGTIRPGEYIFEFLGQAGITPGNQAQTQELIDQVIGASISMDIAKFKRGRGLSHVAEFLQKVFSDKSTGNSLSLLSRQRSASCFRVHIKVEPPMAQLFRENAAAATADVWGNNPIRIGDEGGGSTKQTKNVCLSYWCLTPGKAMHELLSLNVRNIILTSGTLYPISSLQAELDLHSAIVLQNPHVINHDQIQVCVLPKAPDNGMLNSSYEYRGNASYHKSLGLTLVNLFRIVPGGVLIFFPSYALMKSCIQSWQNCDIYGRLVDAKKTFIEPRDKNQFQQITTGYVEAASSGGGSALFAVMRGKVSEGLDLTDHTSRAVFIVGIAYPPREDPRIKIKMAFLDEQCFQKQQEKSVGKKIEMPTGRQWYKLQAWRAVNQAVGRVIRHIRDYGMIFLCDERFASQEARSHLPAWMQSNIRVFDSFGPVVKVTTEFYRSAETKYPTVIKGSSRPPPRRLATVDRASFLARRYLEDGRIAFPSAADHIKTYAGSLASEPESGDFLTDYYSQNTTQEMSAAGEPKKNETPSSSSLLDRVYKSGSSSSQQISSDLRNKRPFFSHSNAPVLSSTKSNSANDDLDQRLLERHRASKRIKLVKERGNMVTKVDSTTPTDYISSVRALLNRNGATSENNLFEDFKSALSTYKMTKNESGKSSVERVFAALAGIFLPLEAPGLLRDFIVFVRQGDKARYSDLCTNITGLSAIPRVETAESTSKSEPTQVDAQVTRVCANCKKSAIADALRSDCGHICCFSCWRNIIEEGNRRCPTCSVIVRRRNLTRLARNKLTTMK
nr:regulator of telomere length splice variant; regulator of telomere elongation helicase [Hymenolepis microstoma]